MKIGSGEGGVRAAHTVRHGVPASRMAMHAVCITLVFVSTRILQFPIPLGYAHLGNAVILLVSVYFGPAADTIAGGLGSALERTGVLKYVK